MLKGMEVVVGWLVGSYLEGGNVNGRNAFSIIYSAVNKPCGRDT